MRNVFHSKIYNIFESVINCIANALLPQISPLENLSCVNKQMSKNKIEAEVQCSSLCCFLKGLNSSANNCFIFWEWSNCWVLPSTVVSVLILVMTTRILRLQEAILLHGHLSSYNSERLWYNFKMLTGKVNCFIHRPNLHCFDATTCALLNSVRAFFTFVLPFIFIASLGRRKVNSSALDQVMRLLSSTS